MLNTPGGRPAFGEDLREPQRRQRRIFRRLHHGDAAGREHRGERLAHDHQRVVEGRAVGDDADRRAQRIVQIIVIARFDRDHGVAARQRQAGKIPEKIRQPRQLRAGLVERPAVVERPPARGRVDRDWPRTRPATTCSTSRARARTSMPPQALPSKAARAPSWRAVDVFRRRVRNPRDHVAGRRIAHVERSGPGPLRSSRPSTKLPWISTSMLSKQDLLEIFMCFFPPRSRRCA